MSDPNLTCEICHAETSVTHQVIKPDLTNYRKCCPKCEVLASRWINKQKGLRPERRLEFQI